MKKLLIFSFYLIVVAGCRKKTEVQCTDPLVYVSKGNSLIQSDWDTIITREYVKGFKPPVVADTFITQPGDVLLISQSTVNPKDFEIELASLHKTYKLTNVTITPRTEIQDKRSPKACYNTVSYTLDGNGLQVVGSRLVYIPLER